MLTLLLSVRNEPMRRVVEVMILARAVDVRDREVHGRVMILARTVDVRDVATLTKAHGALV